ncbi:MAG: hypothetical protein ACREXY_00475 [Gammaproteobacteria bacterium]
MTTRHRFEPQAIWPAILEWIANGDSLTAALRKLDPSPSYWWAKDCLRRDPALKARYVEATEDRADVLAEQLIELADSPMPEGLDGSAASAWIQQLRLQVDVRKWAASKLKPKVYGDRLDVSTVASQISITAALAQAHGRRLSIREDARLQAD